MHVEFWNGTEQSGSLLACYVSVTLSRVVPCPTLMWDSCQQLQKCIILQRMPAERKLPYCSLCYMKTTKNLWDPSQFQTTENTVEKGSSYLCFVDIVNKVLCCYSICSAFDLNILEQGYQLWYYRPNSYFKSGAAPCIAECFAASPTFTHLIQ